MALATWELLLRWLVAFFALLLGVIAYVAWRRSGNPRLLFVLLALLVLLANGAAYVYATLRPDFEERWLVRVTLVAQFLVLLMLYFAVLKRNAPLGEGPPPRRGAESGFREVPEGPYPPSSGPRSPGRP